MRHLFIPIPALILVLASCSPEDLPQEERESESNVFGYNDTLKAYAAKCDAAIGLHVPAFNCDLGTEVPHQEQNLIAGFCDKPNVLNHACDPGSRFQVLAQSSEAAVVAHCRKKGLPGSQYGDIAVIQYNKTNGAVCFYQALGNLNGASVGTPGDGTWPWQSPDVTRNQACSGCHDNGAFIRSPYLAQLNTPPNILPSTSQGYDNLTTPYKWVGTAFANERSWNVIAPASSLPCPPGQTCRPCTSCHRLAVNNYARGAGTASQYAPEATAMFQPAKNPHSATSPIWMRPGQISYSEEAEQSAQNVRDCALTFYDTGHPTPGCTIEQISDAYPAPSFGGAADDIVLVGGSASALITAYTNLNGDFVTTSAFEGEFGSWANIPGVQRLSGDFNHDGYTDFALVGGPGWNTIPTALSLGDGTYSVTNNYVGDFGLWAGSPNVKALVGDYNHDGFSDIALTGVSGWGSIPVAFGWGGGTWVITNMSVPNFPAWAATPYVKALVGDFNKDGYSDIALVGISAWSSIPVAFGWGGGTWVVTNDSVGSFGAWSAWAGAIPVVGDFNRDGYSDIALTGGNGWASIPVAFGWGGGSWNVTNTTAPDFAYWATRPGARPYVGDFNKDGYSDIALTGAPGWASIPVAFAAGSGYWSVSNGYVGSFGAWASTPGVRALPGDFNGDGYTDIALTGGSGWGSIPVAFNTGGGSFNVTNNSVDYFPSHASESGVSAFVVRE